VLVRRRSVVHSLSFGSGWLTLEAKKLKIRVPFGSLP